MASTIRVPLSFITGQQAWESDFDGKTNDLSSGGAGPTGLLTDAPPRIKNPDNPSEEGIRKRTIWCNYRALIDVSTTYFGRHYGPESLIAGREITALMEGCATVMLQIPKHFDPRRPYLITAPSSGSRGVYGGIGVVGEWALKRGFAVVYTDKGTGVGYHNLDTDRVCMVNGLWARAEEAGGLSTFTANRTLEKERHDWPHRIAVKHAHSGLNPQKNWGAFVLRSIEFAQWMITEAFPETRGKIKVIAAGISNGGLSSIMAKEQDADNLIDAVVVSEPNVTPTYRKDLSLIQGAAPPFYDHSRHLVGYISLFNIFQPCASLSPELGNAPFRFNAFGVKRDFCENRCLSLKEKGFLSGDSMEELADQALAIIRESGTTPDSEVLLPSHYTWDVSRSIAYTYMSQYGRFSVWDRLCGFSFAPIDQTGRPRALTTAEETLLFSDQSGIPPLGPVKLINERDPEGPREDRISVSASTGRQDMNLDGALALRRLVTGHDEQGRALEGMEWDMHRRVVQGMNEVRVNGDLNGCPALIVTGRSDAVLPVNHTSRPYVGINHLVEKENSRLRYYEVTGAHHVDALNMMYANREKCDRPLILAPLLAFYIQALNRMVEHLEEGRPLPESQVIRVESPRTSLPDIADRPHGKDRIRFEGKHLRIPD
jgi:hydroxybutyrate-dimer hydrolase